MSLCVLGFSHKTTALEVREALAPAPERMAAALAEWQAAAGLSELMVLSTCNRAEYYFVAEDEAHAFEALLRHLQQGLAALPADATPGASSLGADSVRVELERQALKLTGPEALRHLFRVAASLESMVVGEPQILGQVKEAFQLASANRLTGPLLGSLMPQVFRTAKRVRTETQIARFPVSISAMAVELAARIFDTLEQQTVLVIGAGEMAELAVTHLLGAGIRRLLVTNRTFAAADALAQRFQGTALPFEQLPASLAEADIVISSTGAPHFIVTREMARQAVRSRRGKPIFFIDIAVPRDVDPEVNSLSDVYRYDIDDLQTVAAANLKEREGEALAASRIVEEDLERYLRWRDVQAVVPVIKALRRQVSGLGEQELARTLAALKHLSPQDALQVQRLVRTLVNKVLHAPSTRLKQLAEGQDTRLYSEALVTLFELKPDQEQGDAEPPGEEDANVVHLPVHPQAR